MLPSSIIQEKYRTPLTHRDKRIQSLSLLSLHLFLLKSQARLLAFTAPKEHDSFENLHQKRPKGAGRGEEKKALAQLSAPPSQAWTIPICLQLGKKWYPPGESPGSPAQ